MILNNFYKVMLGYSGIPQSAVNIMGSNVYIKKYFDSHNTYGNGTINNAIAYLKKSKINNSNSEGWVIGDGNTTPSANDYWLSGNQITDFTTQTGTVTSLTSGYRASIPLLATADITIREIGFCMLASDGSEQYNGNVFMVYREVLETPITVLNGNSIGLILEINGTQLQYS